MNTGIKGIKVLLIHQEYQEQWKEIENLWKIRINSAKSDLINSTKSDLKL